ncbi:MAG TPA: hypothetical protein ENI07_15000 [Desulfobacterales bacterium]|nr:hypothetical protein [Desulfobacterales bacterium]
MDKTIEEKVNELSNEVQSINEKLAKKKSRVTWAYNDRKVIVQDCDQVFISKDTLTILNEGKEHINEDLSDVEEVTFRPWR